MKFDIKNLVDEVFRGAPDTKKAAELKEEIYQNLCDRYDELIRSKSDRDAMESIKAVMGDFTPLIEALSDNATKSADVSTLGKDGTVPTDVNKKAAEINLSPDAENGNTHKNSYKSSNQSYSGNNNTYNYDGKVKTRRRMSRGIKALIIVLSIIVGLIIISGIASSFAHNFFFDFGLSNYFITADDLYSIGNADISDEGVDGVNVKWIAGNVNIKFVDRDTISFSEDSTHTISTDMQLRYRVKDGELEIMYGRSRNIFFGFWGRDYSKDLTIELPVSMSGIIENITIDTVSAVVTINGEPSYPEGIYYDKAPTKLDMLIINTVSGNVRVDYLSVLKSLEIQTVSGIVKLSGVKTSKCVIGTVSGDVNISGEAEEIDFDSVSGSLVYQGPLPDLINTDTTSGVVKLTFSSSDISGFIVNFDSLSGLFSSDYPTTVSGGRYINGDGSSSINFDSVSGGLSISYSGASSGN